MPQNQKKKKRFYKRLTHCPRNIGKSEQISYFSTGTIKSLIPFILSFLKTHHDKMIPPIYFNALWGKRFAQMVYMYPFFCYKWHMYNPISKKVGQCLLFCSCLLQEISCSTVRGLLCHIFHFMMCPLFSMGAGIYIYIYGAFPGVQATRAMCNNAPHTRCWLLSSVLITSRIVPLLFGLQDAV